MVLVSLFILLLLHKLPADAARHPLLAPLCKLSVKCEVQAKSTQPIITDADSTSLPLVAWQVATNTVQPALVTKDYPLHKGIKATYFEAGTPAGDGDAGITNVASAWIENWTAAFGGQDRWQKAGDRNATNPYLPAKFTPKENPFYVALPADPDTKEAQAYATYWGDATKKSPKGLFKDQWVEVSTDSGRVCYAQWEDVGPGAKQSDFTQYSYVFGTAAPKNSYNGVGIDVSPACAIALGLTIDKGMMNVNWRFVDMPPTGPWLDIVTQ